MGTWDRDAAQRFGRRLGALVHGLIGAAITVVVLRVFADVSLWWLAPVALLFVIAIVVPGFYAARLLDGPRDL